MLIMPHFAIAGPAGLRLRRQEVSGDVETSREGARAGARKEV